MPEAVRFTLIALSLTFIAVGGYHRVQSQRSGERLDRTKEGWPLLIGIRTLGLLMFGSTAVWLWKPSWFQWASRPMPAGARWMGVIGFAGAVAWLIWMFHTLGRNLTDTVVTRREAYLVDYGPYRFVRNPMYTGILMVGMSLGFALGTWLLPLSASLMFALLAVRTRTEERYLIERFGDRYRCYMERVGRFVPKRTASQ
ncbi:MAG: isoprenylcysteine carboxylmethyltransferase family protein [Acetobacteraceae bacterium]|nr:isoprenylcysteine carboxylmethyltransferase family protein [Acetobacteraceae bacterium]